MLESKRIARLNQMRGIATGLLVLMALVFVATRLWRPDSGIWAALVGPLGAFAEAAMIGALADWFAVTALFRRPLGLPIPHTDVIASNKDRIGSSLADFLSNNFMTREVISEELASVDFSSALAHWLAQPDNSRAVAGRMSAAAPALLAAIETRVQIDAWLRQNLAAGVRHVGLGQLLAEMAGIVIAQGGHQNLFERVLRLAAVALEEYRPMLREKFLQSGSRWIPEKLDEHYFRRIMQAVEHALDDASSADSVWRARIDALLADWIDKLRTNPEHEEHLQAMLAGLLEHPSFAAYVRGLMDTLRQRLLDDVAADDSKIETQLSLLLQALGAILEHDTALRQQLNGWMRAVLTDAIVGQRKTIAALVERVIAKWDGRTVARKLELQVGRDLQYIRINGTLVGGAVGLALYYIGRAF